MSPKNKYENLDLYGLLEITIDASLGDIKKAYRKKALKCHPDKNPDNPKAAELFHELSYALEVLLDESTRAAYDKLIKAKEAAKLRHKDLDDKRKKFKADLEAREEAYFASKEKQKSEEERLKDEIDRLRKEGAKLVQDEIKLLQEEINNELRKNERIFEDGSSYRIKVEWKVKEDDTNNGGYDEATLHKIFYKHGNIAALVLSSKKKGQALVEYETREAAEAAMQREKVGGLMENPFTLKWADKSRGATSKNTSTSASDSLVTERDYESLVLRNLRQAEERRKLIEQMQNENDE